MNKHSVIVIAALLASAGCARHEFKSDAVAWVGSRTIDARELTRSFTLHPEWKKGETEAHAYLTQLHALLAQKIYAQEAEHLGMDRDSMMAGALRFIKEKEMIKGLYRRQISEKVQIADAERQRIYEWSKKKVDIAYVFCLDSALCASFAGELKTRDLDALSLPADSSVVKGMRQGVKVGTVTPALEQAIFTSRLGDVRGPIRVRGGFMCVKVTGGEQEKFLSENELILQRDKVTKLLTERKADSLSGEYVYSLMQDTDLRLVGPIFWQVADDFARRVKESRVDRLKLQNVYITVDEIRSLNADLGGIGDAVVATHRDGALTVKELLSALANMPGSLRPRVRTPQNLKDAIGRIVRNQYLLKEARREGLDSDPEVLYEYGLQRDEALSAAYYARRRGEVALTDAEVEAYRKHAPVSEEQVFFRFNMSALARSAKADSLLEKDLPGLLTQYGTTVDTMKVRSMTKSPDAPLKDDPIRVYMREIFM
ncbi:MAG TPA: hypothetical protein VEO56_15425 [Bacteroidota bacterium]|nr:hypothetical protein [Bacteroidota bacterium]